MAAAQKRFSSDAAAALFLLAQNPLLANLSELAEGIREQRAPAAADNPLVAIEQLVPDQIEQGWNFLRDARDAAGAAM
jgi:hypothetical protein